MATRVFLTMYPDGLGGCTSREDEPPPVEDSLFFTNFSIGETLAKTENGFTWGASNHNAESSLIVTGTSLQFNFVDGGGGAAWCEQRYASGAQQYSEKWSRMVVAVPLDFVPSVGNAKGPFTQWVNSANDPGHYNDGYEDPNGLLIGTELWDDGAGGWAPSIRISGSGYDINARSGGFYFPDGSPAALIPASAAGKVVELVQMFKYGTVPGTTGNLNEDWVDDTPGLNGVVGLWSRIPAETSVWTVHYYKTNCNLYPHPSAADGSNRAYCWGWINDGFDQPLTLNVLETEIATADIWGVL